MQLQSHVMHLHVGDQIQWKKAKPDHCEQQAIDLGQSLIWLRLSIQFMKIMKRRGDKTYPCLRPPTPTCNGFDCLPMTRTQTSGWQLKHVMAINSWPSMPYSYKTLQSLSRRTRSYAFSRSIKHAKRSLPYSQDLSKVCFRVTIGSVVLRPGREPHCSSSNLDSTISRHFLSRHLAYSFPNKLYLNSNIPLSLCIACGHFSWILGWSRLSANFLMFCQTYTQLDTLELARKFLLYGNCSKLEIIS